MSVVGFDLSGREVCMTIIPAEKISYPVEEIPTAISFKKNQRFIGAEAVDREVLFSHIMKLIGKNLSDISSDPTLDGCLVKDPNTGLLFVRGPGLDDDCEFTATHLLAMVLSDLKFIAEAAVEGDVVVDRFCIGIPTHFTKSQRVAVRQAAEIADLHVFSLMNATTAIALSHGINGRNYCQKEGNIAFVDVDNDVMQVCLVCLEDPQELKVLSYTYDFSLGEDSIINALLSHFGNKSKSPNDDLHKECKKFMEQMKQKGNPKMFCCGEEIKREEFANICKPLLHRMKLVVSRALDQAALKKENIDEVILTGSAQKIGPVVSFLHQYFGKYPKNASKVGVSMGCAMNQAIQSKEDFENRLCDDGKYLFDEETAAFIPVSKKKKKDDKDKNKKDLSTSKKKDLSSCTVKDDLSLSTEDERTMVANVDDGRSELTTEEITAARDKERKMLWPKKVQAKITNILKFKDYINTMEQKTLDHYSRYMSSNDQFERCYDINNEERFRPYVDALTELDKVAEVVIQRKNEQEYKDKKINELTNKINDYTNRLLPNRKKYCRIPKTAKDEFKTVCDDRKKWLADKKAKLREMSKTDGPINFIADVDSKIKTLHLAWYETLKKR